jgi:hypothetical protein
MRHKIVAGMCIGMLLIVSMVSIIVNAGDEENPEVEDKKRDVKLFGLFRVTPQFFLKHVDVISTWFHEDSNNPEYLYVSLKLRDIESRTRVLEAIYDVDWTYNNKRYIANVNTFPSGVGTYYIGKSLDWDDDFESWNTCAGTYNFENDVITWEVPKNAIGSPQPGDVLNNISPHTHLRFTYESGLPMMDLFKDLSGNAKTTKEYIIQY